jgi:hypothetical protein
LLATAIAVPEPSGLWLVGCFLFARASRRGGYSAHSRTAWRQAASKP